MTEQAGAAASRSIGLLRKPLSRYGGKNLFTQFGDDRQARDGEAEMRAKRQRQQISPGEPIAQPRLWDAGGQQAQPSPVLALQGLLQDAFYEPEIEERLPVGQRMLIVLLLAAASWGLVAGLVLAVVH